MKKGLYIAKEIISWVLLIAVLFAFIFSVYLNITKDKDGEGVFLLGYRPVLVLTGSMEPYMMTNGLALTKEVTDISQIAPGDVITFHVESESGKLLRITHRIETIEDGFIYTKGDNNSVSDNLALTIENVEAKVVGVCNATAWIVDKWQSSTAGKVMLISFAAGIILVYFTLKMLIRQLIQGRKSGAESNDEATDVIDSEETNEVPPIPASDSETDTVKESDQQQA